MKKDKEIYPKEKTKGWMDAIGYCWYCDKNIRCECMDATCWVCSRPYAKDRCQEFGFDSNGKKLMN